MAMMTVSGVPRYIQLSTLFRHRINSGLWPEGSQIPTIGELTAEYGVSPATIRQAIGLLATDGLVARHRAKGTFVIKMADERLWCEVETDWNGLLNARTGADIEILLDQTGPLDVPPPHTIGTVAERYRHLRRIHSRDGQRYLLADVYIDADLAARLPESSLTTMTALRLAASIPRIKIADARQTLTVGMADLESSLGLDVPLNAPICFIDRSVADQRGRLILFSKGLYRGDLVRMDTKLR
jgi:GntR family transcriptional regulator